MLSAVAVPVKTTELSVLEIRRTSAAPRLKLVPVIVRVKVPEDGLDGVIAVAVGVWPALVDKEQVVSHWTLVKVP